MRRQRSFAVGRSLGCVLTYLVAELFAEIVRRGRTVSAYVTAAVRHQLAMDGLAEIVADYEAEHEPLSEAEVQAAQRELFGDALSPYASATAPHERTCGRVPGSRLPGVVPAPAQRPPDGRSRTVTAYRSRMSELLSQRFGHAGRGWRARAFTHRGQAENAGVGKPSLLAPRHKASARRGGGVMLKAGRRRGSNSHSRLEKLTA